MKSLSLRQGGNSIASNRSANCWSVLVQREMECGRSPLASIARALAGRVPRPSATVPGTRKQRTETATGFKRRPDWVTICAPGAPDTEIVVLRPGGRLGLTAEAHTRSERPTGWEKEGCAAYFNGMTYRASGRFRCPSEGCLAGLGRFNFRVARHLTRIGQRRRLGGA